MCAQNIAKGVVLPSRIKEYGVDPRAAAAPIPFLGKFNFGRHSILEPIGLLSPQSYLRLQ